jgi:hypothetical protein
MRTQWNKKHNITKLKQTDGTYSKRKNASENKLLFPMYISEVPIATVASQTHSNKVILRKINRSSTLTIHDEYITQILDGIYHLHTIC